MMEVLNSLASRAQPESHPLLQEHGDSRVLLVVVTADKGLCGGFNANIIRAAVKFLDEKAGKDLSLDLVGRKGRDFFRRRRYKVRSEQVGVFQKLSYTSAQNLASELIATYTQKEIDQVYIIYNEFKSVIQQKVIVERLLPIQKLTFEPKAAPQDYIYEPGPQGIVAGLLPKHVEIQIWRALLESAAAEHGARMAAMDAATNNASDMIQSLTLYMNKVRQAAITKEIIEVVSGAGVSA
jgi:F-type H+-transporting ATPase subunit gamma